MELTKFEYKVDYIEEKVWATSSWTNPMNTEPSENTLSVEGIPKKNGYPRSCFLYLKESGDSVSCIHADMEDLQTMLDYVNNALNIMEDEIVWENE